MKNIKRLLTVGIVLITAMLVSMNHAYAGNRKDSVIIHVRVFPAQAEAIPFKTRWNVQATLCEIIRERGYSSVRSISGAQSAVANNKGELTFTLPVDSTQYADGSTRVYLIECLGGWAYWSSSNYQTSSATPGEYNVTLNMKRK